MPTKALLVQQVSRAWRAWQESQDLLALQGRRDCKAWPEWQVSRDLLAQLALMVLLAPKVLKDSQVR